ncbi:MAG: rod shape-determining protein MreC [Candidatus Liptonbacteria bacterium]|nr:rod shape-determining protein MreC [Candidatus Liptonbacteria bacterium]
MRIVIGAATAVLAFVLIGNGNVFTSVRYALRRAVGNEQGRVETALQEEIVSLKAELETRAAGSRSADAKQGLAAPVFSTYPYNTKHALSIGAGSEDGVRVSDAVVQNGILIGQVSEANESFSIARTIFDPNWEFPVRIGSRRTDALLRGGPQPRLTLIPKEAPPVRGDVVVTAFSGIPYGIPVGTVEDVIDAGGEPFVEATVAIPYIINRILDVVILDARHG